MSSGTPPASPGAPPQRRQRGAAWIAGGVLALAALAIAMRMALSPAPVPITARPAPAETAPAPLAQSTPTQSARVQSTPTESAAARKPSFDVVRVAPDGGAVIAGRAEPGAEVTVHDGEQTLGRTRADDNGQWVLTPDRKLAPGARELTLSEQLPGPSPWPSSGRVSGQVSGGTSRPTVRGDAPVVLDVPDPKAPAATPALAVLTPDQGAPRVLQGPSREAAKQGGRLGLDAVDYDQHGDVRFSGGAPPGTPVRVYVDSHPAGDARADAHGRWTLAPGNEGGWGHAIAPGKHQLRVDQLNAAGRVVGRVELPFQRVELAAAELGSARVVVQPGDNLWRIARATYGRGVHYVVIYRGNLDRIRDPARIYPGQTFALPSAPADGAVEAAPTPSSASRSR